MQRAGCTQRPRRHRSSISSNIQSQKPSRGSQVTLLLLTLSLLTSLFSGSSLAERADVDALVAAVLSGREGERMSAASRLYHRGEAGPAVAPLLRQLRSEDPNERCLAARLLGLLHDPAAEGALLAATRDDDWAVRRDAVEALGQIRGGRSAAHLEGLIDDPQPRVRIAVARALAELGRTERLAEALSTESEIEVRLHLVEALARGGSPAGLAALRQALEDDSEMVRVVAATVLVERGDPRGVEFMVGRASSPSVTVRRECFEALARATSAAVEPARQLLRAGLGDDDARTSLEAATSLARLGDPRGVVHLRAVARGEFPAALRALALTRLEQLEE